MHKDPERASVGIAGLDEVLHGGLIPGRLYLVDGNPGAGKTTLALQFLLEGARVGEKCLYVTLSETQQELETGALSHGWSLEGVEIMEIIADEQQLEGEEELTMLPPSEIELSETTRKVIAAVERNTPTRLVLDSLSELRLLAQSSLRYRRQVLALKQFFIGRRCTVMMLDDRTSEGPDLQLHSIAHGVIALDSHAPPYGQIRRELQIRKFRGSDFVSGVHDYAIRRGGLIVFPRLIASKHAIPFKSEMIPSGVASLDAIFGGGVERGTSTLLIGPPGSGKSTLAVQYAIAAAARGDHAVAFLFDESRAAMLTRSAGLGMRLKEGTGPGEVEVRQMDPAAVSPGEFAHLVRQSVERDRTRVVVIDSLNGYLNAMPLNNFLISQLHELLAYLNGRGVITLMIVAQSGLFGHMSSPIDASYLADSVVLLRFFEHGGAVKKAISVLKRRTGGHEDTIRELTFDGKGVHLGEPLLNLRRVLTGVPVEVRSPRRRAQPQPAARS
ncbi:MAG TPA: ATPase domain-containing protein [Steroidobacteraceae bacterium]|nr:ATPase domain-containing protein [Steroidobacteraceae bacterium]